MPEVESLAVFLRERAVGRAFVRADITAISALKTYDPPVSALVGLLIDDVQRHGKFLDFSAQGVHLVIHLARAGWLRWRDEQSTALIRPGKGPIALRTALRRRVRVRPDRGRHSEEACGVRRSRPGRGAGDRAARPGAVLVVDRGVRRDPQAGRPGAAEGRAAQPVGDRRDRQRLLRRDPARREDEPVQTGLQPDRRRAPAACTTRCARPSRTRSTAPPASPYRI